MQTHLEFRVVITGYVLVVLTLSTVTAVVTVQSVSATSANQTGIHTGSNMTFVGNMTQGKSMMMPGGNMQTHLEHLFKMLRCICWKL